MRTDDAWEPPTRDSGSARDTPTLVKAPAWPVVAALLIALAAVALAALGVAESPILELFVTGYVLGAVVVPVAVLFFRLKRQALSSSPWFVERTHLARAATMVLLLGGLGGLANAWWLATELARR
ncbi:MAG: hypothetical protein KKE65_04715 [Actinobacteria bacterium]|nr:hypothetical protein [Actinomycetota bacterium]MBU2110943.1 hypothetical protein [Actinomycetota bacterium]